MSTPPMKNPERPASKNAGMPFGKDDPKRRQQLLIGGIGGVALVVAMALLFIFRPWQHPEPKLGGEPVKLSQYVSTPDFQGMSFEKREIYMKMMHAKKDQIVKSYTDGQLTLEDYQKALQAARFGKRLDEMRKYFAKPLGNERTKYLDKLIAKDAAKDETIKNNPAAKEEEKEQDLLKDDAADRAEIATWPQEVQTNYMQYRTALSDRKKLYKAARETKTANTAPTTLPTAAGG